MHAFRIIKLMTMIFILAYFVGIFWFIYTRLNTHSEDEYTFYNEYDIGERTNGQSLVIMVYFAFTTLTTVGFGDYNPKSEMERVLCAFIFLAGVSTFSYIMNELIAILLEVETVSKTNEEREALSKWMGMLTHFNRNKPLPKPLVKRFE